jgi:hypothetical protein
MSVIIEKQPVATQERLAEIFETLTHATDDIEAIEIVPNQGVNVPIQMFHFKEHCDCGGRFLSMFIVVDGKCRLISDAITLMKRQRNASLIQAREDQAPPF